MPHGREQITLPRLPRPPRRSRRPPGLPAPPRRATPSCASARTCPSKNSMSIAARASPPLRRAAAAREIAHQRKAACQHAAMGKRRRAVPRNDRAMRCDADRKPRRPFAAFGEPSHALPLPADAVAMRFRRWLAGRRQARRRGRQPVASARSSDVFRARSPARPGRRPVRSSAAFARAGRAAPAAPRCARIAGDGSAHWR